MATPSEKSIVRCRPGTPARARIDRAPAWNVLPFHQALAYQLVERLLHEPLGHARQPPVTDACDGICGARVFFEIGLDLIGDSRFGGIPSAFARGFPSHVVRRE